MDTRTIAVKAHRARMKKRGMKRVEVSVPASQAAALRRAASMLRGTANDVARLRQTLGFTAKREDIASAVDLFAMPEPWVDAVQSEWDRAMQQVERDRKNRKLNRPRKITL